MTKKPDILIVEDDRDTLAGLTALLRSVGYGVTGAASFEEGRRALQQKPALLMTDVRLGAYNGLHLIIRARAEAPHLPAIVLTGHSDVVVRREAERLGAVYIEKPVVPEKLLVLVSDTLSRRDKQPQS